MQVRGQTEQHRAAPLAVEDADAVVVADHRDEAEVRGDVDRARRCGLFVPALVAPRATDPIRAGHDLPRARDAQHARRGADPVDRDAAVDLPDHDRGAIEHEQVRRVGGIERGRGMSREVEPHQAVLAGGMHRGVAVGEPSVGGGGVLDPQRRAGIVGRPQLQALEAEGFMVEGLDAPHDRDRVRNPERGLDL